MNNDKELSSKEKIILGIDPGTQVMGYGLIIVGKKPRVLQFGVLHLKKYTDHAMKLKKIYDRLVQIIDEYHPDEVALEAPFFGKNVQSMLKLGRAQGVAMAAALSRDIPINEYEPKKVKQSVTGNGNASKEQLAEMLKQILNFKEIPKLLDGTDALGVALCHHYNSGNLTLNKTSSWNQFLSQNPDRLKKKK
ncbi:MAG: crossover junction endodeoxyribonuclease RuvC [Cyclobacteriaceae bacterium]